MQTHRIAIGVSLLLAAAQAPGQEPLFVEVAQARGLEPGAAKRVHLIDLDGDDWLDAVVEHQRVYLNVEGPGGQRRFRRVEAPALGGEPVPTVLLLADLDQHWHAIGMDHGGGDGGEGEGRDQHARTARQVERLHGQEQRGGTGGYRQRIAHAQMRRELCLKPRHRRALGRGVAEQVARLQKSLDFLARGGGDRFGLIDIGGFRRMKRQSVRGH